MDFGKTVLLFISVLGAAIWIGLIMKSEGEDKYIEACRPITTSTKYLIKVATGLTGRTPDWTVSVKKTLDGGCYYFFATFLFQGDLGEGVDQAVRTESAAGSQRIGTAGGGLHQ